MIRDSEFSKPVIQKLIVKDVLGRNRNVEDVIRALNSIQSNAYIALDARWGAGKTTFIKELEYLASSGLETIDIGDIDQELVKDFQDKYIVFYYNAWENDHHSDPLQSILFNLIGKLYSEEELRDKAKAVAANAINSVVKQSIKALSNNIVDIKDIMNVDTMQDLVKEITTADKRKEAVSKIISSVLIKGKRLLFVVDELDRCSPDFAVGVLEAIKHYYTDDNSIFLLATNNRQLVHTVKKHYGEGFNGFGYLDKFYDLVIDLPKIEIKGYINKQLGIKDDSYYINIIPREVADYLDLSPRQTNRYISTISLIQESLDAIISQGYEVEIAVTSTVFIPFALALKIKDITLYDQFISGKGEDMVREMVAGIPVAQRIVEKGNGKSPDTIEKMVTIYRDVINAGKQQANTENYNVREAFDSLNRILPIINVAGLIDKKAEEPKQ